MPGPGASARVGEKPEMTEELTKKRAGMEEALATQVVREEKGAGARVEHHAVQGDGEELGSSDESARLRTLPQQEMVDDALEELDQELEKVSTLLFQQFRSSINTREPCFRVRVIGGGDDVLEKYIRRP